jgi:hypothetical protein|nr:MAG TPA: hypothetical protein [Bacteriophage sp.]
MIIEILNYLREKRDIKLRMSLLSKAGGYTIQELPMVYSFVLGGFHSILELKEFREWKEQKRNNEVIDPSRPTPL